MFTKVLPTNKRGHPPQSLPAKALHAKTNLLFISRFAVDIIGLLMFYYLYSA